ncbi:fimbrial protein [Enterobacteriaceae bacterium RIT714]|nr:fimbrial protein [Enterobacteriaceae bacterium RIT714]
MFKTYQKFIFLALVVIFSFFHPLKAHAETGCSSQGGSYMLYNSAFIARDMPIGQSTQAFSGYGSTYNLICSASDAKEHDVYFKITIDATPVDGYTDVYPTNMPAMGVRFNFRTGAGFCGIKLTDKIENSSRVYTCHLSGSSQDEIQSSVELVRIADDDIEGMIQKIPAVKTSYHIDSNGTETPLNNIWSGQANLSISLNSCSLAAHSIAIPLGDVSDSSFTGVGSTSGAKAFSLKLSCNMGLNVHVALDGKQNADTSDTSVLALTEAGEDGTAGGIGVQILFNDTPLKLSEDILVGTTDTFNETYNFMAQYIQTKPTIDGGTADTTATFNVTYQ